MPRNQMCSLAGFGLTTEKANLDNEKIKSVEMTFILEIAAK